jgi:hypothetical protein
MGHRLKSFTLLHTLIVWLMLSLWLFQSQLIIMRYHQLIEMKFETYEVHYALIRVLSTIHQSETLDETLMESFGFKMTHENEIVLLSKDRLIIEYYPLTHEVNVIWSN